MTNPEHVSTAELLRQQLREKSNVDAEDPLTLTLADVIASWLDRTPSPFDR